ncbi:TetR/AcrR family transcriptional regulator [Pseudomonas sp. GD03860]|uniref:TetR/AcrR family transcriptional regulator n=1 Tax=Pseudomonas TaxID=286 RepID=UPI0023634F77|nr:MULTISPECIES: TetR/AcrR family transcriptional regulator [Pseudomonas]MDD2057856.1 TetR/AcrR family transcriptional regulator [Pseudomonas putida]MDH0640516.1 TetR/AcrR family transcriptional regulator [Pseudomonas sp. GD03860]
MRSQRIARLPPRERVLDAAHELFFNEGISRVTVDAIAAKAETTKMTVYRHFESKDTLVLSWLQLLMEEYDAVWAELAERFAGQPARQILGFAEFLVQEPVLSSHRGCAYTNTLAELPVCDSPARTLIEAHKRRQANRLVRLCEESGLEEPQMAAFELTLLLEGVQIVAQNKGFDDVASNLLTLVRKRLGLAPN